jgi:acyl-CoA synthetase (AMP-forming)/AMP-acid ligase II
MDGRQPTANLSRILDWARYRFADREALVYEGRIWTYWELDVDVNALAAGLRDHGVRPDDRVALYALNSPEYMLLALAIAKLGAVMIPLNYRLHEEELHYLLDHAQATTFASEPELGQVAEALARRLPRIRLTLSLTPGLPDGWVDVNGLIEAHRGERVPDAEVSDGDLQRVLYTSGTTSRPKGARITHGNCNANMAAQVAELELSGADRLLNFAPFYHVGGLDVPGYSIWYAGGTMVVMRRFDPRSILQVIEEQRITGMAMVATMVHMIRAEPDRDTFDLGSVRWLIFSQVTPTLYRETRETFPNARLVEGYGMTETCNGLTYLDADHMETKLGTAGRPIHGVDIRIVDTDDNPLPAGEIGEIVIRGPKVCDGYLDDPEATALAFRNGWFHSGDVGRLDEDGYLTILDRLKDMIRPGGENVASSEIEAVVYELPWVHEAAVIGIPDERWVEVPAAFVVPTAGASVDADALIVHCRAHLGGFKVPKAVYVVEQLPRNPSGKVLKRDLRDALDTHQPLWRSDR